MKLFSVLFTVAAIGTAFGLAQCEAIGDGLYAGCVCLLVVAVSLVWIACLAITTDATPASAEQLAQITLYHALYDDAERDAQDDESGAGQAVDVRDSALDLGIDRDVLREAFIANDIHDLIQQVAKRSAQPSNPEAERHMMHSAFLPRINHSFITVGGVRL